MAPRPSNGPVRTKLRRNDPCHCGSGKKYKKCHLDQDRARERSARALGVIIDYASLQLAGAMEAPDFSERVSGPADGLNEQFRSQIGEGLEGKAAADALTNYLDEVEAEMARVLARHSRGYWLHVTRRLPSAPLGSATPWTAHLYKRVLTLAALKHGAPETLPGEFQVIENPLGPQQTLENFGPSDAIEAFALEYLAYEYINATQAYRRVGKGARLERFGGDFAGISETDELEELMQDVDRRVELYGELVSESGMSGDRDFRVERTPDRDAPLAIVVAQLNVKGVPGERLSRHKGWIGGPANFVLGPLVIDGYREAFENLSSEFEQAVGVDSDLLLATIWGLSMRLLRGIEASAAVESQVLRVGYLMVPDDYWSRVRDDVAHFVGMLLEYWTGERSEAVATLTFSALSALSWSPESIASISLWDRLPARVIIDVGGFRLIDYAAFPALIADVFRNVGAVVEGAGGGPKGTNFETVVAARVRAAGLEPWLESREVHHQDGAEREIDLGVVSGDTLFVVECKARVRGNRIDRGDWSGRLNRQDTLLEDLEQARTLAEFLREEPRGADYQLPNGVTRFEPVLCTPGPEFIWSHAPELWLTETIPRICTPDELVLVLADDGRGEAERAR